MSHTEDLIKWYEFGRSKGISESMYRPLIDRGLAWLGFKLPPFAFWSPTIAGVALGGLFGLFWCLFMYIFVMSDRPMIFTYLGATLAAIFFGIVSAIVQFQRKRKFGITSWDAFKNSEIFRK